MILPISLPYMEVVYFLFIVGAIAVGATAVGALLRAWSWKVPRTLAAAFLGVIVVFVIVSWLFSTLSTR